MNNRVGPLMCVEAADKNILSIKSDVFIGLSTVCRNTHTHTHTQVMFRVCFFAILSNDKPARVYYRTIRKT